MPHPIVFHGMGDVSNNSFVDASLNSMHFIYGGGLGVRNISSIGTGLYSFVHFYYFNELFTYVLRISIYFYMGITRISAIPMSKNTV